ncbi:MULTISPECIES: phage tail tube protein [Enterocloster]|jgi:hypothetical protein|uniref:Phage tail tube protein, TTP n=1 Tax=Enterocloster lavalensis TaxID=460384 RepID=A0A1I0K9T7_9FIRM|nr:MULTISPECIES: phage tail tube protein [Enterocloster]SEU20853.1 Phage tail tube protein, TTP [Enterocloster lavalensis]DAZ04604.1 MAG TPA: tail tube protein [Caudoviricetes sp.]
MLANGAKLGFKKSGGASFTDLPGLKEIPEMGIEPEKVENTCLTDKNKQYENGIGDPGDLVYKFRYENTKEDSPYRVMRKAQDSGEVLDFQETLIDGTTTEFSGQVSVKRTGGGVNGVVEFNLSIALQSELKVTDPGTSAGA